MTVHVAVPNTGSVRTGLAVALLRMAMDSRYNLRFHFHIAQPVGNNCNQIVKRFLGESGPGDFLLILGSNVVPLAGFEPLDLVELERDVVMMPCPIWKGSMPENERVVWNLMAAEDCQVEETSRGRVVEVLAGGSGAMLIARRVLAHPEMRGPFLDEWDEDGIRVVGEDLGFCYRARAAGFRIWAALDYVCDHEKPVGLLQVGRMHRCETANGER